MLTKTSGFDLLDFVCFRTFCLGITSRKVNAACFCMILLANCCFNLFLPQQKIETFCRVTQTACARKQDCKKAKRATSISKRNETARNRKKSAKVSCFLGKPADYLCGPWKMISVLMWNFYAGKRKMISAIDFFQVNVIFQLLRCLLKLANPFVKEFFVRDLWTKSNCRFSLPFKTHLFISERRIWQVRQTIKMVFSIPSTWDEEPSITLRDSSSS